MHACNADKKTVDIIEIITGKGEVANKNGTSRQHCECCVGQKAGDLVAATVPAFIAKCSRMDIRHSMKTRLFHCMAWALNDALLLPWVECMLNLAVDSFCSHERLGRRQRQQC